MSQPVIIQIENIYYPILAIVGVPANLVTILILLRGRCGLTKCITHYLLAMAIADLMVLIFEVILYEINDAYFSHSFLNYTPICSLNLVLLFVSIDLSVWFTVAFSFDRFIAICHQTLRMKYCTKKCCNVVLAVICLFGILQNIPTYFIYEPREIIDNIPWSCYTKPSFYTLTMFIVHFWLDTILTPFLPFILILLFNALTIRHILVANRIRIGLRSNKCSENHSDPEIKVRRKSIILLLVISGTFILLWMVNFIFFISVHFINAQFLEASYDDPATIAEQSGYMLRCLSSCTNTFIYAASQRQFRDELMHVGERVNYLKQFGFFMRESAFHPQYIKEAIPYGHAQHIHRTCSDEEKRDRHLKVLKGSLIRMGYDVQPMDYQFRHATMKSHNDLLRRQTQDMTDRVPFVTQYFPGAEKLCHVLHSLQHVIDNDENLAKIFAVPELLEFK
ncbi:probable G-protein coupled receptor 139 [Rhincodon typus]|uniref:probable G-protein coupled receptor 139 n=1 Tax=Rhincodon typus TaxID=259920 RepID=UPI00203075D8|nr:probable G-protein coupled receptor 139 [Rhincodon typus]